MTQTQTYYEKGQRVRGTYYGVAYSGSVEMERQHTVNWHQHIYFINLDTPITVLGATRNALCLTVDLNTRQPNQPDSSIEGDQ